MLLRYGLGEEQAAKRIEDAVLNTLNKGFRTGDIFSEGTVYNSITLEVLSVIFLPVNNLSVLYLGYFDQHTFFVLWPSLDKSDIILLARELVYSSNQ